MCIDCRDAPEFADFFGFAEHILKYHKKHELTSWAKRTLEERK